MVGVGEEDLRAGVFERLRKLRLHGGLRADGHEQRREHFIVQSAEHARARLRPAIDRFDAEVEPVHE